MRGRREVRNGIRGRGRRLCAITAALLLALLPGCAAGCAPADGPAEGTTTAVPAATASPTPSGSATATPATPGTAVPTAAPTAPATTGPAATTAAATSAPSGPTAAPTAAPLPTPTPVPPPATVTVSVVCHTAVGKADAAPADGIILAPVAVELRAGDTVLTVLVRAVAAANPSYGADNVAVKGGNYVAGIGNDVMDEMLYEKDCGPESGWLYYVDGTYAGVGASTRAAQAGETIEWKYTCASGRDLG